MTREETLAQDFLTPNEVAKLERVHIRCVYRWLVTGQLKAERRGRTWKIRPEDLRRMSRPYKPDPIQEFPTTRQEREIREWTREELRKLGMKV